MWSVGESFSLPLQPSLFITNSSLLVILDMPGSVIHLSLVDVVMISHFTDEFSHFVMNNVLD